MRIVSGMRSRLPWSSRRERARQRAIVQHATWTQLPSIPGAIEPDVSPRDDDVAIAARLLAAHRAARDSSPAATASTDVWTLIAAQQSGFASVLERGSDAELAAYLCNVSRRDASIGITQGDREYERISRDSDYREFLSLMIKDKLVSLAEAVGCVPLENPEQGVYGQSLQRDLNEIVHGISSQLGIDVRPPDIDGGLFKVRTDHGSFGERDANAIFTATLLKQLATQREIASVCEIGGGSGRAAYWSLRLGLGSYAIVDLPHVNVVQGYYLMKSLPEGSVCLYGEQPGRDTKVTIWPNHAIGELSDSSFDLVVNQDSMPEMSRETVQEYLRWIRSVATDSFLSINHESKPEYGDGLAHVSVPEAIAEVGGFTREERWPYWLRKGYVVERYGVGERAASTSSMSR